MAEREIRPKARRKLTRAQVQEILERNIKLYKDEDSFITYLVDLAIYLLEYEYNWEESYAQPPEHIEAVATIPPKRVADKFTREDGTEIIRLVSRPVERRRELRACTSCGSMIGDESICPQCRNVVQ
jgi:hypothetical protein